MTELVIRIKEGFTLADVANEVTTLNQFAGTPEFPRPIPARPDAEKPEDFLGLVNTPPDENGFVTVRIDYEYLDLGFLPQQPQTFNFVFGKPATVGTVQ